MTKAGMLARPTYFVYRQLRERVESGQDPRRDVGPPTMHGRRGEAR